MTSTIPMRQRVTATELARNLSDILNRIQYHGERFVVERNGELVANLGPAIATEGSTLADIADRLRETPVPHDGFGDVLANIKASQPIVKVVEWPS